MIMTIAPLLNNKQIAASLPGRTKTGTRGPEFVSAMVAAGFRHSHGTCSTLRHVLKWLEENPDFRTSGYKHRVPGLAGKKRKPRKAPDNSEPRAPAPHPAVATADTSDAPARRSGSRRGNG